MAPACTYHRDHGGRSCHLRIWQSHANRDALTLKQLITAAMGGIADWLMDRKNRRAIPHRLERCGYVSVRGPCDGQWKIGGERQTIYAKQTAVTASPRGSCQEVGGMLTVVTVKTVILYFLFLTPWRGSTGRRQHIFSPQ